MQLRIHQKQRPDPDYTRRERITNGSSLYTSVKDLHLREWLLSHTPAEEFDETNFATACSNSLVVVFMQIKKQFALE